MAKSQKITEEDFHEILRLLDLGLTPFQASKAMKISHGSVYYILEKRGVKISSNGITSSKRELIDEDDFSTLPDSVLFSYKKFPAF
jgi:hypothetical protein